MIQQKLSFLGLDQRLIHAAGKIIESGSCAVSKHIRAGLTSSSIYACESQRLRLLVLAPTRRILIETMRKASQGAIRIPGNSECPILEPDIKKNPILSQLPLNLPKCEHCEASEWCDVLEILRVKDFTILGLTYPKLEALMLSKSEIAQKILEIISVVDVVLLDESHLISLPTSASVKAFITVGIPEGYPVLNSVLEHWSTACQDQAEVMQGIMQKAKDGHVGQHLAENILNPNILPWEILKPAWSELRLLAISGQIEDDKVLCIRDIITILGSTQISIRYVSEQEGESGAVYLATGAGRLHRSLHGFLTRYVGHAKHIYCSGTQFEPYLGFFSELSGKPVRQAIFPDIREATKKVTLIPDRWRLDSRNFSEKLPIIAETIKAIAERERQPIYLLAPNGRKAGILEQELEKAGIKDIFVDFYRSDRSIGVARNERICIAIGLAEVPTNTYDALARGPDKLLDSQKLRLQAVHSATWQAVNRARDPEGKVESRIYFIGCRLEQVRQCATWGTNRQLKVKGSKEIKLSNGRTYNKLEFEVITDEELELPRIFGEGKSRKHSERRAVKDCIKEIELYSENLIKGEFHSISPTIIYRENGAKVSFYNFPSNKDELDQTAHSLFSLFANRIEDYGQQLKVHRTGKWEFICVKGALTKELMKKHVIGEITLGTYQIALDDTVIWCADDFDSHNGANPEIARANARRVVAVLRKYGIPFLLESSGSLGGYHIWILLAKTRTINAFKFFRQINAEAGVSTECWPKQKSLDSKGAKYGNLLKTPICYHNGGGGRSAFLDADTFEPLEGPIFPPGRVHLLEIAEPSNDEGMPKAKRRTRSRKDPNNEENVGFRPCLKAVLESGNNLEGGSGHDIRLAIAAEAKCAGIPLGEAIKLFSHLPDFNESTTRKHLESVYNKTHGRHRCDNILEKTGSIIAPYCQNCRMPWASENLEKYVGEKRESGN
jgi:hypothetical protein